MTPFAYTTASVLATFATDGTWFNRPAINQGLIPALLETLAMVSVSTIIAVAFGLPIGILLTISRKGSLMPNRIVNAITGAIVNLVRSVPFIILMMVLVGFTAFVVGRKSGWQAASVSLSVAAIPYVARLIESNLSAVERGKIEAAEMMGASRFQIVTGVLIKESLPGIIQSITITIITLIGYSAMAGAIGGGGLGTLAVNQGYYNNNYDVMIIVVVLIVIMVQIIQMIGDMISRLVDHR